MSKKEFVLRLELFLTSGIIKLLKLKLKICDIGIEFIRKQRALLEEYEKTL